MKACIDEILELEWEMFSTVNGENHVSCQEDPATFAIMRRGQYEAWSEAAVQCYLGDLRAAAAQGRNLAREKYIRMMESTDPRGYEAFRGELPTPSESVRALTAEIWALMAAETEELRRAYPLLALGGRPLYKREEKGWPSVESYQTCELLTFSEETLLALLARVKELEARGGSLAHEIQLHTVRGLGYASLRSAEDAMTHSLYDTGGPDYASRGCGCRTQFSGGPGGDAPNLCNREA